MSQLYHDRQGIEDVITNLHDYDSKESQNGGCSSW